MRLGRLNNPGPTFVCFQIDGPQPGRQWKVGRALDTRWTESFVLPKGCIGEGTFRLGASPRAAFPGHSTAHAPTPTTTTAQRS